MSRRMQRLVRDPMLAVICALASLASARNARAQPTLIPLAPLPSDDSTAAFGMSADGTTAVGYSQGSSGTRAVRWVNGGPAESLGSLAGLSTAAYATSADGTVVVGQSTVGTTVRAFRWTAGFGMVDLAPLGDTGGASASGVSSDGSVIVGSMWQAATPSETLAFVWRAGEGMQALPLPVGASRSVARGVSADGTRIVGSSFISNAERACYWSVNGVVEVIELPSPFNTSFAAGVSLDGSTIVGGVGVNGAPRAYRWTANQGVVPFQMLPGDETIQATTTNGDGTVVFLYGPGGFIWTGAIGMVNLQTYVSTLGTDLTGWLLTNVQATSADGRTVAGHGLHNGRSPSGFLLQSVPPDGLRGACCNGGVCSWVNEPQCGGVFQAIGSTCDFPDNPVTCCRVNINQAGGVTVQDIFDFLTGWFGGDPAIGNFNGDCCITPQDIFDFLAAWFAGC